MIYDWNREAETVGGRLITKYHPHLGGVKIAYLFKEKPPAKKPRATVKALRSGKKHVWAKACLVPARYSELLSADYKFVIEFDREVWDQLTLDQQEALVDHELCHCGKDEKGCYMRQHDLEEFRQIVERHGFWKDDVRLFAESCQSLFEPQEKKDPPAARSRASRRLSV